MIDVGRRLNQLYDFAATTVVDSMVAHSADVIRYCVALREIQSTLDTNSGDVALTELNRLASRFRFRILSAPLPFNHPALFDDESSTRLKRAAQQIGNHYQELRRSGEALIEAFSTIRASGANPLWDAIEPRLTSESRGIALVVRATQLAQPVQDLCEGLVDRLKVLTESQLRQGQTFPEIYLFGAMRWYGGFVFSAPRSPKIVVARYSNLQDGPPREPEFIRPIGDPVPRVTVSIDDAATVAEFPPMAAEEVLPIVDVDALINRVTLVARTAGEGDDGDDVEVKVLLLDQGLAVLVPHTEHSTELVIDLGAEAGKLVHRVRTAELENGMAVLVRTEGGGSYIVPAADQIMGDRTRLLRRAQSAWKEKLRELVLRLGPVAVVEKLASAGSRIASDQNLRNWISTRSIRTLYREDFDAIFDVIGASSQSEQNWRLMEVIQRAHQRAGALIRRRLLEQVRNADLSILLRDGRMDFTLPGDLGGGGITAVRISSIAPDVRRAPWSAVHRLIHAGE